MRDIYKQAAEVIVWLGEEDEPSKRAIGCLEDIALMSVDKERIERCLPILLGLQVKKDSDDPIGPLFKRSWFSRMWTIQEWLCHHNSWYESSMEAFLSLGFIWLLPWIC